MSSSCGCWCWWWVSSCVCMEGIPAYVDLELLVCVERCLNLRWKVCSSACVSVCGVCCMWEVRCLFIWVCVYGGGRCVGVRTNLSVSAYSHHVSAFMLNWSMRVPTNSGVAHLALDFARATHTRWHADTWTHMRTLWFLWLLLAYKGCGIPWRKSKQVEWLARVCHVSTQWRSLT